MSFIPTCSVIGHVDVGKTSFLDYFKSKKTDEVRGITQQLSVYRYDKNHLSEYLDNKSFDTNFNLGGVTFIDTPGHEYFTTMRTITSSISHLVIVVIDIVKGIESTHIEILKYLKDNHIDFIILLNKIDRIYNWKSQEKQILKVSFSKQSKEVMKNLQDYINNIVYQLACNEINACAYYNNSDYKTFISMIPISAKTGEGIVDLMLVISKIMDKKIKLFEKSLFYKNIKGFVIDSRIDSKFGKIITVICHQQFKEYDEIDFIDSNNKIIKHKIKHIIKDNNRIEYANSTDVVYITLDSKFNNNSDLESGQILLSDNSIINYKDLILSQISLNFSEDEYDTIEKNINNYEEDIHYDKNGITIISLSKMMHGALYRMFKKELNVPVAICTVDKLNKNTIIKSINNNKTNDKLLNKKYDYYRVIIIFEPILKDSVIDSELVELAQQNKLTIIASNSIYKLKEKYENYYNGIKNKIKSEYANLMECELGIIPNCIFMKTSPLLFGVRVKSGKLNIGTKLLAFKDDKSVVLGTVKSMEKDKKPITEGNVKDEICIRVEMIDKKIVYKTDFDEFYKVKTYRTNEEDRLYNVFNNELKV